MQTIAYTYNWFCTSGLAGFARLAKWNTEDRGIMRREPPNGDQEQRRTPQPSVPPKKISRPAPRIIDTTPLHAIPSLALPEPLQAHHDAPISRRDLLMRWGGAAAAGALGVGLISRTKPAQQAYAAVHKAVDGAIHSPPPPPAATAVPVNARLPLGYFHGFFEVNTPAEVDQAAALGVNYTITYGGWSWDSADVNEDMGKALLRNGMKTFLNVEWPYLKCINSYGALDLSAVRDLVGKYHKSPLVAGYWIKDDDCGDVSVAVLGLYNLIRSIDTDPTHLIMPGFGDAGSVARNYAHGQADLLGFYPYPAYSRGPAGEVPDMVRIVKERTPAGATPPPFIGIYQDFASPPYRPVLPVSNVLDQVKAYMDNGAIGVAGFGWEAPNETHVVQNDDTLRQAVGATTGWLTQNGYGAPAKR